MSIDPRQVPFTPVSTIVPEEGLGQEPHGPSGAEDGETSENLPHVPYGTPDPAGAAEQSS